MTNIFIKTFGCTVNQSDSEVMAGLLAEAEFEIVKSMKNAELVIVNTCVVKGPTENKVIRYIDDAQKTRKKIIIAGCITKTNPGKFLRYSMISPKQINNIAEVVEEVLDGNIVHLIADDENQRLNLPKIRKNNIIEIVPICAGCLGSCAYCIVKKARGHLVSYNPDAIIEEVSNAVKHGAKEVWLTAQDTGAFGHDIKTSLPVLLKQILAIQGDFKVRLGMINPNHVLKFLDELIEAYKDKKMFKFLHMPIQSGNDDVLKSMNRKYTTEQIKQIIAKFREAIHDITIATDIICGFPGETEQQFNDTIELIRWLNPDALNISKYWSRPGTKAANMKNEVEYEEIRKRSKYVHNLFRNIAFMVNERWYNWSGDVIIDEINKDGTFTARNHAYKPVIITGDHKIGDEIRVRIRSVGIFDLKGEEIRRITL